MGIQSHLFRTEPSQSDNDTNYGSERRSPNPPPMRQLPPSLFRLVDNDKTDVYNAQDQQEQQQHSQGSVASRHAAYHQSFSSSSIGSNRSIESILDSALSILGE